MVVAETKAQAMDAAEAVEVQYEELPFVLHSEDAMQPGAPAIWDEVPDNMPVETFFGDREATDRAFARAAHVVTKKFHIGRVTGVPMEPRSALGAIRCRDGPLHALCRLRRRGAAEERADPRGRRPAGAAARDLRRRRRQFRHAQPHLCRVRPGAVGGGEARPAGQIHRDALGSLSERLSGPRSGDRGRARARRRSTASSPCAPPISAMSARAACRCRR